MKAAFWRACSLALLLLFTQQLALTHALEHIVSDRLQFEHGDDDAADCPQCLALGGLLPVGATQSKPWVQDDSSRLPLGFALAQEPTRRALTAHAIRAPPANRS